MIETTIAFDPSIKGRCEGLALWGDPIDNCRFHPFGIVRARTIHTFLDLCEDAVSHTRITRPKSTYQICDNGNVLRRRIEEPLFKSGTNVE